MSEENQNADKEPTGEDYPKLVEDLKKQLLKAEEDAAWSQREIQKLKTAKEERDKMIDDKANTGDPDAVKRIKDEYQTKLAELEENLNRKITERENELKHERVIKTANQKAAQYFNDDALDLIESKIAKFCDWEDGEVIIKDDRGEVRYSQQNKREKMGLDEFMKELADKYPSCAKPMSKGGTQQPGQKVNGAGRTLTLNQVLAMNDADQRKAFAENKELAKEVLRTVKF